MKGKVKFFNEGKGFGFITADDGKEYFMHITGFSENLRTLHDEDAVTFDVAQGDRGPKAVNIALDDGSAAKAAPVAQDEDEDEAVEETEESEEESEEDLDKDYDPEEEEERD